MASFELTQVKRENHPFHSNILPFFGVSEAQVAREDITQKSTKTIPLRLERAVTQYGDFQFA